MPLPSMRSLLVLRQAVLPFLFLLAFSAWGGCRSSYVPKQAKIDKLLQSSKFVAAAKHHSQSFEFYPAQDELLYYLNQSYLDYYSSLQQLAEEGAQWYLNGQRSAAFERVEDMLRRNDSRQTSFRKQAASNAGKAYSASLQESLWQNVFASLYYWNRKSLGGALVELRRSHQKTEIYQQYSVDSELRLGKGKDALLDFRNSALMQYLGMLYYREDGRLDDWRISRDDLKKISFNSKYYAQPVSDAYLPARQLSENNGSVNFCIFTGAGVRKYPQGIRIVKAAGGVAIEPDDGSDPEAEFGFQTVLIPALTANFSYYEMMVPVMRAQSNIVQRIEVLVDGQLKRELYPLEAIAEINMEVFRRLRSDFLPKQITAFILKVVASELAQTVINEGSAVAGLIAGLLGSAVVKVASPSPDLRIAAFSPSVAWVGELQLAEGQQQIEVLYYSESSLLHRTIQSVAVRPGETAIVQDYYAR